MYGNDCTSVPVHIHPGPERKLQSKVVCGNVLLKPEGTVCASVGGYLWGVALNLSHRVWMVSFGGVS